MIIRAKTFRDWMKANFDKQTLRDLAEYGVQGGFPGLTYYSDTTKLYEKFKDEIWESLIDEAEEYGYKNVYEFIATFNGADVGNCTQHENLLVWYMAEKVARELTGIEEE
jgi:hypothetical protein